MPAKWTPAGDMRQSVVIQQNTPATNSYGEASAGSNPGAWSTFAAVMAKIEQLAGDELWFAQQVDARATHRVTLRYVPGVSPQMQVSWTGTGEPDSPRILQIVDVDDVEGQGFELRLSAFEIKKK